MLLNFSERAPPNEQSSGRLSELLRNTLHITDCPGIRSTVSTDALRRYMHVHKLAAREVYPSNRIARQLNLSDVDVGTE
jgi:hypothetical protein